MLGFLIPFPDLIVHRCRLEFVSHAHLLSVVALSAPTGEVGFQHLSSFVVSVAVAHLKLSPAAANQIVSLCTTSGYCLISALSPAPNLPVPFSLQRQLPAALFADACIRRGYDDERVWH